MAEDKAKYCVWIDSTKARAVPVTDGGGGAAALAALRNTFVRCRIQFPQLPRFEKFLLRLESFAMQSPNQVGQPAAIATSVSLNPAVDGNGVVSPTCFKFVMPRGWNTQSMFGADTIAGSGRVPESRVILGTCDASRYSGGADIKTKGVVMSPDKCPTVVVDRPNVNGTYEVLLECPDDGYFCLGTAAAPVKTGEWSACLSLTPMTNEDLKNWDGRP
ncbi:MAG: hypothetical protein CMI60_17820 [Parvibaculum sp.]|nr:hypothetical protein [Parvibaculum sp.]